MNNYVEEHLSEILDRGIVNRGDTSAVSKFLDKCRNGEHVTVSFIGGSITQGCLATSEEKQYTHRVHEGLKSMFEGAAIDYLNAPVGGTDSQLGVARVERDILSHEPDLLIIEFSVNDSDKPFYMETYEGLVRKVLNAKKRPAVILLFNVMYDKFESAQDEHLPVAKHYHLPSVSMRESFVPLVREGILTSKDLTVDNLHPNDLGHGYVAELVLNLLRHIADGSVSSDADSLNVLPAPITANRFESSVRLQNYNCEPVLRGFSADYTSKLSSWYYFAEGWQAANLGDRISFKVRGSSISIQYRKCAKHPAPIATAYIDGDKSKPVILDANFDQDWGDCLYLQLAAEGLKDTEHTVDIELTSVHENDTAPFYLISIITA
ncbi:MAG: SGNH/GDSL hydrolase family protein [Lachnospiraceae bacterium]|nr:SGNH/GDSL hydrolase family protein [Lachnospiraceae bacterium]